MLKPVATAALTALILILLAETAARSILGGVPLPHSFDTPRNPNFLRAWPAYTAPRGRAPDEKLIILISNSQGYAPELEDASQVYAHRLQTLLNEQDPTHKYIVANWAIAGASGPEFLLLAARAVDHDPDLLMVVTHSNPFTNGRVNPDLSFYISDCNQLIYDDSIRERLPNWFLNRHDAWSAALYLEAHSGLVGIHDLYTEQREGRWEPRQRHRRAPAAHRKNLPRAPKVKQAGSRLFTEMIRVFRTSRPNTPILLISMPLCESRWAPATWDNLASFGQWVQERIDQDFPDDPTIEVVDALKAIDESQFITQAHMTPQGHDQFARYLLPHVRELLGRHTN